MDDINPSEFQGWEPVEPLEEISLPVWPMDVFPEPYQTFLRELSRFTETPPELAGIMLFPILSTVVQNSYQVQIKPGYCEPVNIWTLAILSPASRKSRVFSEMLEPLKEWEENRRSSIQPILKSAESRKKTDEARLRGLRNQAAKQMSPEKYEQLQKSIEELESKSSELPVFPRLWTTDVTPEQLAALMSANHEVMSVLSDEGGIFDILSGLYSDGKTNIDLFLQAHSRNSVRVDRKTSPPLILQHPVLTMGLTIQPQVIEDACRNKLFRGRGLLGRFLYVIPQSNIGFRGLNELPMTPESIEQYRNIMRSILEMHRNSPSNQDLYVLTLTEEAYTKWLEFAQLVESMMGDLEVLNHITDWGGKLPGAIGRIAALLHIMRTVNQKPWEYPVSLEDMKGATAIGHVLINHARIVFGMVQEEYPMRLAKQILSWIKKRGDKVIKWRDIQRKFRYKKDVLASAIAILTDSANEILRKQEEKKTTGRSSDIYLVNPWLLKSCKEDS